MIEREIEKVNDRKAWILGHQYYFNISRDVFYFKSFVIKLKILHSDYRKNKSVSRKKERPGFYARPDLEINPELVHL